MNNVRTCVCMLLCVHLPPATEEVGVSPQFSTAKSKDEKLLMHAVYMHLDLIYGYTLSSVTARRKQTRWCYGYKYGDEEIKATGEHTVKIVHPNNNEECVMKKGKELTSA